jgi:general secretion pathway protein I
MASLRPEQPVARGFTLIEVMIALVIVALGMMAVNTQLNRYVVGAIFIEDKTLASWIATNKVTELSLLREWPAIGESSDEVEFASRRWHVRTEVAETPVENLRRADVHVSLADAPERVIHTVSGLLEPPTPAGFAPVQWPAPITGTDG